MVFLVLGIIALIIWGIWYLIDSASSSGSSGGNYHDPNIFDWNPTPEYKQVGMQGEATAVRAIMSILRDDDRLFTNVHVEYDGKETELDTVIVNKYGVFIIEVKNYVGYITGGEDDYDWIKYKTTDAGNTYGNTVKNPIKQVKRQIYILARYLEYYGSKVWVRGYALLIHGNSPVESEYVLWSIQDIDRAIHTPDRKMLNKQTIDAISKLLS
ncbi:nuclease-related domain-containing protein [Ruminococcus flavefaciens]|uniref:nuclease-related domain-containing protein n=1 Tax=Ruminococcus flavefaciens TaxID=1265 RepID=UPI00048D0C14|nr:nuclease-related domain-containing protein [Ruminococcus flavefaciens]